LISLGTIKNIWRYHFENQIIGQKITFADFFVTVIFTADFFWRTHLYEKD